MGIQQKGRGKLGSDQKRNLVWRLREKGSSKGGCGYVENEYQGLNKWGSAFERRVLFFR